MHFWLEDPATGERLEFGPVTFVRLDADSLQIGPQREPVARFQGGAWVTGGKCFPLLRLAGPVVLSFEEGEHSETYGPFDDVLIVSGLVRYGSAANAILARLDQESSRWQVGWERRLYQSLVVEAL